MQIPKRSILAINLVPEKVFLGTPDNHCYVTHKVVSKAYFCLTGSLLIFVFDLPVKESTLPS